ncbi:MAG: hypothetical protein V3V33_01950 [Candidatus Lokiarchaeia archaeon]
MASARRKIKDERKAIYFDIILGIISSVLALIGIIFVGISGEVKDWRWYIFGLTFWICWLIFSSFLIGLGIYLWHQEKHYDERELKEDLKAPIV